MGFFNDLKEDLASAVNELTDEKAQREIEKSSEHLKAELAEFENEDRKKKNKKEKKPNENLEREIQNILNGIDDKAPIEDNFSDDQIFTNNTFEDNKNVFNDIKEVVVDINDVEISEDNTINVKTEVKEESVEGEKAMEEVINESFENENKTENVDKETNVSSGEEYYDNLTLINAGTNIKGSIDAEGSVEIDGVVEGDVKANGELIVTGTVIGDVEGLVVSLNSGKIRGNVKAYNGLIISDDSVLIGDIESNEAEIAGAVKGKIDVNGPVVLKPGAKVLGDIDCKSVEICGGAVIEGKCSQKYAEVSPSAFFENL